MTGPAPRRTRWLSAQALRLHATLIVVASGCLAAGGFELSRALGGNELSWVYVFEWPFFAVFSARIWWRSLHEAEDTRPAPATTPEPAPALEPAPAHASVHATGPEPAPQATAANGDAQLQAWQDYLARLHAQHPPGGPPDRAR